MSPIFGKHEGSGQVDQGWHLPQTAQLGSRLEDAVEHVATLTPEQLAAVEQNEVEQLLGAVGDPLGPHVA